MAEIGVVPGGGLPWGDIVKTDTPFTDKVTATLLAQQADRRKYQQETSQHADELMNKELANVRSADMNQVIDSYGRWKNISMQMLNPKVQSDPKLFNQLQQQKNAALGETMGLINRSAQYNALGKQIGTNLQTRTDHFDDNAGQMLSQFYKTPMDQLTSATYDGKPIDLTNLENYRYKGGNFDFSKLNTTAAGKPVIHYDNGTTDASGLQTTQHGMQFGNTPSEYRNSYLGGLSANQANRGARYNWLQHSQQELDALDAAYQSSPNWQKMGLPVQQLPPYNPNDPVGNEATFQAKQYLASMNPAEVKASAITNQGAKMDLQFAHQQALEVLKEGNRETRDKKKAALQLNNKLVTLAQQSQIANQTFQDILDQGVAGGLLPSKSGNQHFKEYDLGQYSALNKDFAAVDDKGHPIYPSTFRLSEDKKSVRPVFFVDGEEVPPGKMKAVNQSLSKPIPVSVFKALVSKELFGAKEAVKESTPAPTTTTIKTGASGVSWQ